jgi:carbon monoxide dehydrogenase subunit G
MKLRGTATVRAPIADVYAALVDPAVLVRTIPGCERLEQTGADSYRTTVTAGVAAIKGSFAGQVKLSDQRPPAGLTLHASGAGVPGTVEAVARLALRDGGDGSTVVEYDADATIGGMIGGVGQRVLAGVARRSAADFFAAVDRELTGAGALAVAGVAVPAEVGAPAGLNGAGPAVASVHSGLEPTRSVSPSVPAQPAPGPVSGPGGVWVAPESQPDPARQRVRDLLVGAAFGAAVALLGVLVGALVAGW